MISSILSNDNISTEQKKILKHTIVNTLSECKKVLNGNIQPEKIISFVEQKYEETYPTEDTNRMFTVENLKKVDISDKDWTFFCEKFGIFPNKDIVYK
jgi:hypothetical protein